MQIKFKSNLDNLLKYCYHEYEYINYKIYTTLDFTKLYCAIKEYGSDYKTDRLIFIVQTNNNIYYVNVFEYRISNDNILNEFSSWLTLNNIEYNVELQESKNTYSWVNWSSGINSATIKRYIFLGGQRDKNIKYFYKNSSIFILRYFLLELSFQSNFYFIYMNEAEFFPNKKVLMDEILFRNKMTSLHYELKSYTYWSNNQYRAFREYWMYVPKNKRSFLIINFDSLIRMSIRFGFTITHYKVNLKQNQEDNVSFVLGLFSDKFYDIKKIQLVGMFKKKKQKNYEIFVVTNTKMDVEMTNEFELLFQNQSVLLERCDELDNGFGDLYIEINSLVFGLYSKNTAYWEYCDDILPYGRPQRLINNIKLKDQLKKGKTSSWFGEDVYFMEKWCKLVGSLFERSDPVECVVFHKMTKALPLTWPLEPL